MQLLSELHFVGKEVPIVTQLEGGEVPWRELTTLPMTDPAGLTVVVEHFDAIVTDVDVVGGVGVGNGGKVLAGREVQFPSLTCLLLLLFPVVPLLLPLDPNVLDLFLMMVSPSGVMIFLGHLFSFVCLIRPFLYVNRVPHCAQL